MMKYLISLLYVVKLIFTNLIILPFPSLFRKEKEEETLKDKSHTTNL